MQNNQENSFHHSDPLSEWSDEPSRCIHTEPLPPSFPLTVLRRAFGATRTGTKPFGGCWELGLKRHRGIEQKEVGPPYWAAITEPTLATHTAILQAGIFVFHFNEETQIRKNEVAVSESSEGSIACSESTLRFLYNSVLSEPSQTIGWQLSLIFSSPSSLPGWVKKSFMACFPRW